LLLVFAIEELLFFDTNLSLARSLDNGCPEAGPCRSRWCEPPFEP
jgi:hypothetical protein